MRWEVMSVRLVGRLAMIAVFVVGSSTLTGAPASAEAKPSVEDSGIVYGLSTEPTVSVMGSGELRFHKPVQLFEHAGYSGEKYEIDVNAYSLVNRGGFDNRASSLGNWGTGYDMCFYADRGYLGRWIWLRKDKEIANLADGNWLNDQITSVRAAPAPGSC
ncbi:peptidase inhibitor family I36 protein [Micromonospora sp. NPDC049366]|uniref:peptidase inhibitor family I36 protein n=1 Tax=Micromonospora sp. NPDC049366 TaxID=3364271 RepID=UPI0037AF01EF